MRPGWRRAFRDIDIAQHWGQDAGLPGILHPSSSETAAQFFKAGVVTSLLLHSAGLQTGLIGNRVLSWGVAWVGAFASPLCRPDKSFVWPAPPSLDPFASSQGPTW